MIYKPFFSLTSRARRLRERPASPILLQWKNTGSGGWRKGACGRRGQDGGEEAGRDEAGRGAGAAAAAAAGAACGARRVRRWGRPGAGRGARSARGAARTHVRARSAIGRARQRVREGKGGRGAERTRGKGGDKHGPNAREQEGGVRRKGVLSLREVKVGVDGACVTPGRGY